MIANILIALVALLHLYFLVLEMFLWDKPQGMKAFGSTPEFAKATKVLAANQGLYNGFLAAGLIWGLWLGAAGFQIKVFFLALRHRCRASMARRRRAGRYCMCRRCLRRWRSWHCSQGF